MKPEEANKIIAEYMGFKLVYRGVKNSVYFIGNEKEECASVTYTQSLDALVPVWQKMSKNDGILIYSPIDGDLSEASFDLETNLDIDHGGWEIDRIDAPTIQEAAAISTAIAIRTHY